MLANIHYSQYPTWKLMSKSKQSVRVKVHDIISLHCFVLLNPLLRRRFFAIVLAGVRTGGIAREKEDCQQSKSG